MYRVLIVDDEKEIREGLARLTTWESMGIGEVYTAEDGDDALELLIEHRPELVITDIRMNRVSGLAFIRQAVEEFEYEGKFIVISGFDEFQYAQSALTLGVSDYLLKPIQIEELHRVIMKCVLQIDQALGNQARLQRMNRMFSGLLPAIRTELLREMIESAASNELFQLRLSDRLIEADLIWLKTGTLYLLLVEIDDMRASIGENGWIDKEILLFAVGNVLEFTLKDRLGTPFVLFMTKQEQWAIICQHMDGGDGEAVDPVILVRALAENVRDSIRVSVHIAYSTSGSTEALPTMYKETRRALSHYKIYGGLHGESEQDTFAAEAYAVDMLCDKSKMLECMKFASETELRQIMLHFSELPAIWGVTDIRTLQRHVFEWVIGLFKEVDKLGMSKKEWSHNPLELWEQLEQFDTIGSLQQHATEYVVEAAMNLQQSNDSHSQIITAAEHYMQANYALPLTLQMVAEHVHVTPAWLSRLFKKEKNATFLKYLTDIRLAHAKELLGDLRLKVYHVGEMVGYQDIVYFSRLFRKKYGVTPTVYRNSRGNERDE